MEKLPRRKARENAFIALFGSSFGDDVAEVVSTAREQEEEFAPDAFGEGLLLLYQQNAQEVDHQIELRLKGWNLGRIQRVSLSILRLAVAEMLYANNDLESVIINEAVELAKRYGDENDYQFINGVLGTISRERAGAPAQDAAEQKLATDKSAGEAKASTDETAAGMVAPGCTQGNR